jgi:hypothetical protein
MPCRSCSTACASDGYHTSRFLRVDWQGNVEYVTDRVPCTCAGGQIICRTCAGAGYV